jgi:hypothetical protein
MSRRVRARRLAVIAAAVACNGAQNARADEVLSLAWDAPADECPGRTQVVEAVRAWLDPMGMGNALAAVRVEAKVHRVDDGWRLDLKLAAPGGSEEQSLVAARCETLVEVVALKVALAADPTALLRSLDRARANAATEQGPKVAIRGALGLGLGPLPEPSGFVSLGGSVERSGWRLELTGSAWLPRSASYPELPSVGASFLLLTGGVRGCLLPSMREVDFPICAGAELGVFQGSGFGVAEVERSDQLWAAVVVGPALRWSLGSSASLWIAADAAIGLERPAFHMRNLEQLYRPDAVTGRTWAGVEVRL